MAISLTKDKMEELFLQYLEKIFGYPEVVSCCAKEIVITRDTLVDAGKRAFEAGFHDLYSDIDLSVRVRLPKDGSVTPEEFNNRIDRFGVTKDAALGWMFIPVNHIYRIIFKNGMRYDLIFEFEYSDDVELNLGEPAPCEDENPNWPVDNINRFWFIQIQALGKLYRRDYLISSHLANMNCNDTLVMQMIMRDLEYKTSHHRYGYSEELEYVKCLGQVPYKTDDATFNMIADRIYAAALAYDKLVKDFYHDYEDRKSDFFAIWDWYESAGV